MTVKLKIPKIEAFPKIMHVSKCSLWGGVRTPRGIWPGASACGWGFWPERVPGHTKVLIVFDWVFHMYNPDDTFDQVWQLSQLKYFQCENKNIIFLVSVIQPKFLILSCSFLAKIFFLLIFSLMGEKQEKHLRVIWIRGHSVLKLNL